jgi:hypothetical protein
VIDLNKLLEPLRPDISLAQLASEINALGQMRGDVRLALCVRIARAKEICAAARINIGFERWCEMNLRQENGRPYRTATIKNYLSVGIAADPVATLKARRAKTSEKQRARSRHLLDIAHAHGYRATHGPSPRGGDAKGDRAVRGPVTIGGDADDVNALMPAWEHASRSARGQFLRLIGAELNVATSKTA